MDEAVFQGAYSDLKTVKSRSCLQIVIEIPIERMQEFIAAFGAPLPGDSKWVAIALLDPKAKKPAVPKSGKKPSQIAGAVCATDADFRRWIARMNGSLVEAHDDVPVVEAAEHLRNILGIASRSELDSDKVCAAKFNALLDQFNRGQQRDR